MPAMEGIEDAMEKGLPFMKGVYPFRLGTTSYILPDSLLPNVRFLGPHVDEVELVLFESGLEENLPARGEIAELARVAQELRITYNVHLPTDLYLGDPDASVRERSCLTVLRFHERTLPLAPTTYVLHLEPRGPDGAEYIDGEAWQERTRCALETLVARGVDPSRVALENLGYSLERVRPLAEALDMAYCLDVGHLLRYGHDLKAEFGAFLPRTAMVHLHGVENGVDHLGIQRLPGEAWEALCGVLPSYGGGVSIEVFALGDLQSSMLRMAEIGQ